LLADRQQSLGMLWVFPGSGSAIAAVAAATCKKKKQRNIAFALVK